MPGDVIKIHGECMEVWDYAYCFIRTEKGKVEGQKEMMSALDEGYEPYAVTHWMEVTPGSALTSLKPEPVMVEKHHMRRKHMIKKGPMPPVAPEAPRIG